MRYYYDLPAWALDKLREHGLFEEDVRSMSVAAYDPQDGTNLLDWLPIQGKGMEIPYHDLAGKPTGFTRYRYLTPPARGFGALTGKPLRYVQPKGSRSEAYFPRLGIVPWAEIAANSKVPLIITEGEFKAACAVKHGLPCVGLGGVWSFRSGKDGIPLLPSLELIDWEGRKTYIIFDSDAKSNPDVAAAENKLAQELLNRGAFPIVVRLPEVDGLKKTGLDDFLVAKGRDELETVMQRSGQWAMARELHQLNEEVVYVKDPGIIIEVGTRQRMSPKAFSEHAYANRIYYAPVQGANGSVTMKEKCAPREWLRWSHRAECSRVTYAPGEPSVTREGELNIWKGWGCEPIPGDIGPWNALLTFLFQREPEARQWFEQWLAYPLQHPGTKMTTYALLWGFQHGTGKSFVGYTMLKIYGENGTEISDQELVGAFNDYAENRCFVMCDETKGEGKRISSSKFKTVITRQILRINTKFIPAYTVPDKINYYLTANDSDAAFLEDSDRRAFVMEVVGKPLSEAFYSNYEKWYKGSGPSHLFHYLLNLDLTGFNPSGHAPRTGSKTAMIEENRSDLASFCAALRDDPDTVLRSQGKVIGRSLWTTGELLAVYDPDRRSRVTTNGMGREMKRAGIEKLVKGEAVRTCVGRVILYAVRNGSKFASLSATELGLAYDAERGNKVAKF